MFRHAPIALLEQDLTEALVCIEDMGIVDASELEHHLAQHPDTAVALARSIQGMDANQHALRLFEAAADADLLVSLDLILDAASYPILGRLLATLAAGATSAEAEMSARTLGGGRIDLRVGLSLLPGGRDQRRGILCAAAIPASGELHATLARTREELQRSTQELDHFAYVASHDLQEPLRMVASYTQLLARRYQDVLDERAGKYIHYIVDGAKRMQGLISDLLLLSRVGTRGKPLQPIDCTEMVDQVLDDLKTTVRDAGASVTCDPLPVVMADPGQLAQLFQNLLSNALKFRGAAAPRIHVSARQSGNEWIFSVQDNGVGIPEKHLDAVFLAFRRLHERDRYPGSGIGLALAKKIVERHRGRIWVESEPDHGSTFYVALPGV